MPSKLKIKNPLDDTIGLKMLTSTSAKLICSLDDFIPNPGAQDWIYEHVLSKSSSIDSPNPSIWDAVWYKGGLNSGKSYGVGSASICFNARRDPAARQLISANTYDQLRTSTLVSFAKFCLKFGIDVQPCAQMGRSEPSWTDETAKRIANNRFCTVFGSPIIVKSADAFTSRTENSTEAGRGFEIRYAWLDEYTYADQSAFDLVMGRLGRGPGTMRGLIMMTSSINRNHPYNWAYEYFDDVERSTERQSGLFAIGGSSRENIHADANYVSRMRSVLTKEDFQVEIESEYVATTKGRLINTFDRAIHVRSGVTAPKFNPTLPIHLTLDFNRSPATASAYQVEGHQILGIREWFLLESDTFRLARNITDWLVSIGCRSVCLYGDASGGQRTANSQVTNWQIIRDALTINGIQHQYRVAKANPSIVDSVNGLKLKFDQAGIILNGDTQRELIKDLESVQWDDKGGIDKSSPLRTHLLDGLRYFVWVTYPYRPVVRAGKKEFDRVY